MTLTLYAPPAAAIDWQAFSDCMMATRWSRPIDVERDTGLSHGVVHRAWHGKPIGVMPFLLLCKRMNIKPEGFLVER